ncbi:MAG: hypothetical protein ACLQNE_07425 [Thermoguttaceae bacterium]
MCLHGCLWLSLDLSLDSTVDSWMQPPGIARVSYELPILALRMAVPASGALLGFWIAFADTRRMPGRICLGLVAITIAIFAYNHSHYDWQSHFDWQEKPYVFFFVGEIVSVAVALLPLRVMGCRLVNPNVPAQSAPLSLTDIFGWLAGTGGLLGGMRFFPAAEIQGYGGGLWAVVTVSSALLVLASVAYILRIRGIRLVGLASSAERPGALQFSLLDVFGWITIVAGLLAVMRCLSRETIERYLASLDAIAVLMSVAVLFLCSICLVLGRRWLIVRALMCITVAGMCSIPLGICFKNRQNNIVQDWRSYVTGWSTDYLVDAAVAIGVLTFWLIASLLVIRLAGYRLEWQHAGKQGIRHGERLAEP